MESIIRHELHDIDNKYIIVTLDYNGNKPNKSFNTLLDLFFANINGVELKISIDSLIKLIKPLLSKAQTTMKIEHIQFFQ